MRQKEGWDETVTGKTHLAMGMLCGEVYVLANGYLDIYSIAFAVAASAIGSLLPDIDHPQSMLATSNKATKKVSRTVSAVTQHRGITHTLFFAVLIYLSMNYLLAGRFQYGQMISNALMIGYLSHLVLDTMNEKGVMWLWPILGQHMYVAKIRTGSKAEKGFRWVINTAATAGIIFIFVEQVKSIRI